MARSKSKKQARALAIKLSRQRRSGELVPPPPKGRYSEKVMQRALHDLEIGRKKLRARRKRRSAAHHA
jgi:hypothetical protein